ncbi:Hypothetical protein R9X50_00007400 [Acrodontium crateriforme]|uniref:Rho termination factor N-terminal domain-containing protein n=1 Tax=Acrodontium crateriforme TaxID=150365 RepID=A0AAQ3R6I9_9PEZI|nr:Hypothetical protein R9X50_00007400 [Acrodontium crateriforme]
MPTWLRTQRKQTLLDLAEEAGLKTDADLRKDEIIERLDSYLQIPSNATRLASNEKFEPYYGSSRRTPFKPRPSAGGATSGDEPEVRSVVKGRGKLATAVKKEAEDLPSPSQAVAAVTSAIVKRTPKPRKVELPVSPSDVANQVELQASKVYSRLDEAYSASGIQDFIDRARVVCSSVSGVQLTSLLVEAFAIQNTILPWKYVGDFPMPPLPGLPATYAIKLPDLFILLTSFFWSTTLLWLSTSVVIPAIFAYFYNLTIRDVKRHGERVTVVRHSTDPLVFDVVKALATFIVYGNGVTFGIINPTVAERVDNSFYGGYNGVLIASGIGIIASLYEAAQRK